MECGVIADSGYFSVEYPHLSGNFYAKHQAEVILNSTLPTPHCPQILFLFVSIKWRVSSTPHSSLHTPHCSDVCVFEVNVGDFVADRMIEEDFSDTAEIFYGITDIITAGTFL